MADRTIFVYADWFEHEPVLMGELYVENNRGKEVFSFEYDELWLVKNKASVPFDPDLFLYGGRQYTPLDKNLFGIFSDSCPDRWGRMLMKRREIISARKEERKPHALTESDFLLGVYDETRMGALRFALEKGGTFLSQDKSLAAPPWTTLRTLEAASLSFEKEDGDDDEKWLRQLLAPGSSLGGARPKASVQAPDGSLWIAKFPSRHDEWNSGAWEMVVHDLAVRCGLNVPEAKMETFSHTGSTFLVKRFDREGKKRIHFSSAMTLLGKKDGEDGASYLDIADFIRSNGACPDKDLKELWTRIVFNMAVSNTDDHLRNHGFILGKEGWKLSPLYDVNPSIYGDTLSLAVDQDDNSIDFNLAIEAAEYYNLDKEEAKKLLLKVVDTVNENWKDTAMKYGLNRRAIQDMSPAFDMKYKRIRFM